MSQALIKKTLSKKIKDYIIIFFSSNWKVCIFILGIMTFIMFCRKPDAFSNPQFWAEDGEIFFQQYFVNGFKSFITPYAGYLHIVPRIVALIASWFPVSMAPTIYNIFALVVTLLPALLIFSRRCFIPLKPLVALSIVLVPHSGEVFMNIASAQWYLCLLILILLCMDSPTRIYQYILDYLIVLICGLTGPFIIFLLPLFFVRLFINKSYHHLGMFLLAFICVLFQGLFIIYLFEGKSKMFSDDINTWIGLFGIKLFARLFLIEKLYLSINPSILAFFSLILFILLICCADKKKQIYMIISFLFFGFVVVLSAFYKNNPNDFVNDIRGGDRYSFLFYVMITWSLVVYLASQNVLKRQIAAILIVLILISTSQYFRSLEYVDFHWKQYSKQIESGEYVRVPINPPGLFVELGSKEKQSVNTNDPNGNNAEME